MKSLLVFAPSRADDEHRRGALERTRWIAEQTLTMLQSEADWTPVPLLDTAATRPGLANAVESGVAGAVFCVHGRRNQNPTLGDDALLGDDGEPALDRDNVAVFAGAWIHAVACRAAEGLGPLAIHAGVECFAGYRGALLVEWSPSELPDPIREVFCRLVVSTTRLLARGERSEVALCRAAQTLADNVESWFLEQPDADSSWILFAQQLARVCLLLPANQASTG
ncbi:hypothetical protein [Haliangium sp.]|uniref:hypothetical protein n=1 Tax=Haliangium sp. TaxID=2663208 RepID=UPI003D14A4B8